VVLTTGTVRALELDGDVAIAGYSDGANSREDNSFPYGFGFDPTVVIDPDDPAPLGVAATAAQEALLDPITGDATSQTFYDHFDVTELVINFDMQSGFDRVTFNIVFGSEEFPEYVASLFNDGFGMFLNGVNIAQVANLPINVDHPSMTDTVIGTELDGILAPNGNPVLTFGGLVNPTGNQLRFIVADTSDGILDTTVYFSALGGVPQVPAPPAVWLLGTAVAGLIWRRRQPRA
jgi:hypothetical protein